MKPLEIEKIVEWNGLMAEFENISWYQKLKDKHLNTPWVREKCLHYHIEWAQLMPIVIKIESLGFVVNNSESDTTILENRAFASAFIRVHGTHAGISKLESIYRAAGEFLVWYKNNKK